MVPSGSHSPCYPNCSRLLYLWFPGLVFHVALACKSSEGFMLRGMSCNLHSVKVKVNSHVIDWNTLEWGCTMLKIHRGLEELLWHLLLLARQRPSVSTEISFFVAPLWKREPLSGTPGGSYSMCGELVRCSGEELAVDVVCSLPLLPSLPFQPLWRKTSARTLLRRCCLFFWIKDCPLSPVYRRGWRGKGPLSFLCPGLQQP